MADRFLIVKLSSIGDVLMASPMARALREARPDAYIAWVVEPKSADVIIGNPYLDEVIVWKRPSVKGNFVKSAYLTAARLKDLSRDLRKRRFDVAIDAQGLIRSALVTMASGADLRIGYSDGDEMSPLFYNHKRVSSHSLSAQERYLDLLGVVGIQSDDVSMTMPLTEDDTEFADEFYREYDLVGRKVVTLMPATTWHNKHWKTESWVELVDLLADRFNAVGVLLGSKADIKLVDEIVERSSSKPISAAGRTTLKQAAALIERSRLAVGVDTGLLHASVALDKPSIGLFGPSIWRSFAKRPDYIWLTKDMPCSPCHRHPTCEGYPCIWGITPEEVAEASEAYLKGR